MNIRYKLTDKAMQTYGDCQWVLGEWKETSGEGKLCGPGWMHCYSSPDLAVLLSPIHAAFESPRLFECECEGETQNDRGLKEGWTRMRLVREIDLPVWNTTQRVAFGILCALEVYSEPKFVTWSNNWLSGTNRSSDAAYAADAAADAALAAPYAARAAYAACAIGAIDFPIIIEKARKIK